VIPYNGAIQNVEEVEVQADLTMLKAKALSQPFGNGLSFLPVVMTGFVSLPARQRYIDAFGDEIFVTSECTM
jgi:hypothetical protein